MPFKKKHAFVPEKQRASVSRSETQRSLATISVSFLTLEPCYIKRSTWLVLISRRTSDGSAKSQGKERYEWKVSRPVYAYDSKAFQKSQKQPMGKPPPKKQKCYADSISIWRNPTANRSFISRGHSLTFTPGNRVGLGKPYRFSLTAVSRVSQA